VRFKIKDNISYNKSNLIAFRLDPDNKKIIDNYLDECGYVSYEQMVMDLIRFKEGVIGG
jgi:hypothetical protein